MAMSGAGLARGRADLGCEALCPLAEEPNAEPNQHSNISHAEGVLEAVRDA